MSTYTKYRRRQIAELAGSPREGDMIARDPQNHANRWLVSAEYFLHNFKLVPPRG